MHGQQENRDLSDIYQEGIMSRFGARVAGVKAGTGQYFKNIGATVTGKAAPISAGDASRNAKVLSAYKSATKNLLTDLQKLGLLSKEQLPQQANDQVTSTLASLVDQMQQTSPAKQTASQSPVPANAPGQPVATPAVPVTAPVPKLAQPVAAAVTPATPVSVAAQRKATQTKGGTAVGQLSPEEEKQFNATLPSHPLTSKTPANRISASRAAQLNKQAQPPVDAEVPQVDAAPAATPGKKQLTPEQREKRNASRRARRAAKKAASDEANEGFAFSANLPFNKFFGHH